MSETACAAGPCRDPMAPLEDEEDEEDCRRRHLKGLHLRRPEASPERVTSPAAERPQIEWTGEFT